MLADDSCPVIFCLLCKSNTGPGCGHLQDESDKLQKKADELKSKSKDFENKEIAENSKLSRLYTKYTNLKNDCSEREDSLRSLDMEIQSLNNLIRSLEEDIRKMNADLEQKDDLLNEYLLKQKNLKINRNKIETGITNIKLDMAYTEFWVRGFGLTEIRSLVMDGVINFMNTHLMVYSEIMFSGEKIIQVSNKREMGKQSNKLDILVNGDPEVFNGSSSGELVREDIIIQLALRDISAEYYNHFNVLIVDEVDKSLDNVGVERLVNILEQLSKTRFVILISHDQLLQAQIPATWHVRKSAAEVSHLSAQ